MNELKDVFICHASEDKPEIIKPLVDAFEREGISYWYDEAEIKWGDSIIEKVNEGLRVSRYVIVVISKSFLSKNWPKRELNSTLSIEASTGKVRVLPLVAGTIEVRNDIFQKYPILNDKFYLTWEKDAQKIIDALKVRLGRTNNIFKDDNSVMETEGEKEIEAEEEEKGIWDFVVDGVKTMKDITEGMERMTKSMQEIGEKMRQRTVEVQKIKKSGLPGTAFQIRKIASAASMDMIQHAKIIEEEQPKQHNAWESFDASTSGLVQTVRIHNKEDQDAILKFRSSIDELRSGTGNALRGLKTYRVAVVNLRGISQDINRASKRTTHILDLLISDLEGADSYCTKLLTLLDEKIKKECNIL